MSGPPEQLRFLSGEDVLQLHANTIAVEGGAPGLRDSRLLESAVVTPRQQFGGHYLHEDLAAMTAAYVFHLARNHPFVDGNKRVAALAGLLFLDANDIKPLPDARGLERSVMAVASGKMSKAELIEWFRGRLG